MSLKYFVVLLFASNLFSYGCGNSDDRIGASLHGIIGGTPTNYQDWQGVVLVTAGGGMCSGTLIHPRVVLSAGHCVKLYDSSTGTVRDFTDNPNRVSIRTGTSMFDAERAARATEIVTHPTWDGELGTDAADLSLIHLDTALTNIPHYAVRDFPVPESGTAGKLVGYGTDGSGSPGSSVHRIGDTTLLNVFSDVIETGGDSNTCEGDSGGPLFTEQDGEWVVTGVTSFGTGDCYEEGGSYSVNVLAYCDWLNETMMDFVSEDLGLEACTTCSAESADSWGQPCGEGYQPCPEDTKCRAPAGFSDGTLGYCGPSCCDLKQADAEYCSDISGGEEKCAFMNSDGSKYCAIHCEDVADCPDGTACKNKPWENEKICIAAEDGPGGPGATTDVDIDSDSDSDSDTATEADSDTDSDTGEDTDTDSDVDAGLVPDTDDDTASDEQTGRDADAEEQVGSSAAGCGCFSAGDAAARAGSLHLLRLII